MSRHIEPTMRLEVAPAASRSCAFMPVEHASAYLLAQGIGETPLADAAARTALDIAHGGFRDMRVAPHIDNAHAHLTALETLFVGTLAANYTLHEATHSEEPTGASLVGVALRGTTLCLVRAGSAHAHRLNRRGLTELVDPASTPGEALGLAPKVTGYPFTAPWERGDVLLLSCGSLVDAVGARAIARAVLETETLADAAQQLVAQAADAASLALVRWVSS